jgi:hypothetical protein
MPGGAPEVSGGGLDGRTSDSALESDRRRFKTESESSREQDSWSNNTSPGCEWRASPDAKSAEQQASPSSESPASAGAKRAFVYFLTTSFKSLRAELPTLLKHLGRSWRQRLGEGRHRAACATGDAGHPRRRREFRVARLAVARASEGGGRHIFSPQAGFQFLCLRRGSTAASPSFKFCRNHNGTPTHTRGVFRGLVSMLRR